MTLQFASISEIFGGSVLVEQVFSYLGLGQAAVTAGLGETSPLLLEHHGDQRGHCVCGKFHRQPALRRGGPKNSEREGAGMRRLTEREGAGRRRTAKAG